MTNYEKALAIQEQIVADRRWLHQHAETGHNLPETVGYVRERLTEMGYVVEDCGDHGLTTSVGGKKGGKVILLRADMDALPILEASGLDFACTVGNGHCCGHDLHTSSLLGAAKLLKENEDELEGTVKFMFQPAEEVFTGAKSMINAGILTNAPIPDVAFGTHVSSALPTGYMATAPGTMMSSCDGWQIDITGSGGHGSTPELCVDPINIGVHMHLALQELISREISFLESAVLTVGEFKGGTAFNIIPQTVVLTGTLRTLDEKTRAFILKRMKEVTESVAQTYRGTAVFTVHDNVPGTYNNPELTAQVQGYVQNMSPEHIQIIEIPPAAGSEDFSFVSHEIPSAFVAVGAKPAEIDDPKPQHHPAVIFDEKALPMAAAMFVTVAENWLRDHK